MPFTAESALLLLRAAAALIAALAALALLGAPAHAATRTTTWYSIDVAGPPAASAPLFLATGPNNTVNLQRYVSGAPQEQWTPVYPEWPHAPTVTGHGPLDGIGSCFTHWGCPFKGHAGGQRKFVNRLSGRCLTLQSLANHATRVVLSRCSGDAPKLADQTFEWVFADSEMQPTVPRYRTALAQTRNGRPLCLAAGSVTPYATVGAPQCGPSGQTLQQLRFLQVDTRTCDIGVTTNICGLPSWWRA